MNKNIIFYVDQTETDEKFIRDINYVKAYGEIIPFKTSEERNKVKNEDAILYEELKNEWQKVLSKEKKVKILKSEKLDKSKTKATEEQKESGKEKNKKGKILTSAAAITVAAGITAGATVGCLNKNRKDDNNQDIKISTNEFESLTVNEIIEKLKDNGQKDAYLSMNEFQKYFNENAANSIYKDYDGENKLYLTAEEVEALFVYLNAETLASETFANIFEGKDKFNSERFSNKYTDASRVLATYYMRATETSGISNLFKDEENKTYFDRFEQLLLEANINQTVENKEKLQAFLKDILYSDKIDTPTEKYSEAVGLIETSLVPAAYAKGLISTELYEEIVKHNETNTCNNIKNEIKGIEDQIEAEKASKVLMILPEKMDKENIKALGRDINLAGDLTNENKNNNQVINNNNSTKVDRDTAIKNVGKEEVKRQEAEALNGKMVEYTMPNGEKKKITVEEANQREKIKSQGLRDGYSKTYEETRKRVAKNGKKVSIDDFNLTIEYNESYKDSYMQGFKEGSRKGVILGYTDGIVEYEASKRTESGTTITEEEETIPNKEQETTITEEEESTKEDNGLEVPKVTPSINIPEDEEIEEIIEEQMEESEKEMVRGRK